MTKGCGSIHLGVERSIEASALEGIQFLVVQQAIIISITYLF